jgi:hypothetical protein
MNELKRVSAMITLAPQRTGPIGIKGTAVADLLNATLADKSTVSVPAGTNNELYRLAK